MVMVENKNIWALTLSMALCGTNLEITHFYKVWDHFVGHVRKILTKYSIWLNDKNHFAERIQQRNDWLRHWFSCRIMMLLYSVDPTIPFNLFLDLAYLVLEVFILIFLVHCRTWKWNNYGVENNEGTPSSLITDLELISTIYKMQ